MEGFFGALQTASSQRLNVLGLLRRSGEVSSYVVDRSVTSNTVTAVLDDFIATLDPLRKTVIVLDNAPTHSSETLAAKRHQWQEQQVELYYLPPYSPELNLIERLWQAIKYQWLPFSTYLSFQHLHDNLLDVLAKVGSELTISFD